MEKRVQNLSGLCESTCEVLCLFALFNDGLDSYSWSDYEEEDRGINVCRNLQWPFIHKSTPYATLIIM